MLERKMGAADKAMGWMEFVSSLVGSLAWPVAAVIIVVIFHKQIAKLLAKVRKLNWGEASVELTCQLDKVEDKAREIEAQADSLSELIAHFKDERAPDDRFQSLLAISPSAAILEVWKPVERRLIQMAKTVYGNDAKYLLPRRAAEKLAADGAITPLVVQMVQDLQRIRTESGLLTNLGLLPRRTCAIVKPTRCFELASLAKQAVALASCDVYQATLAFILPIVCT
jgi:hypothetical protein